MISTLLSLAFAANLFAAPVPRSLAPETRRTLAAALIAEADTSRRDWAGIAYVLARRARRQRTSIVTMTRRYCAAWRASHARARRMRRLGAGHETDTRMRAALQFVARWERGWVADPCRGRAWHWGGEMDRPQGRMVRLDCGPTLNTFYGLK